jgi:hypothetical protein
MKYGIFPADTRGKKIKEPLKGFRESYIHTSRLWFASTAVITSIRFSKDNEIGLPLIISS